MHTVPLTFVSNAFNHVMSQLYCMSNIPAMWPECTWTEHMAFTSPTTTLGHFLTIFCHQTTGITPVIRLSWATTEISLVYNNWNIHIIQVNSWAPTQKLNSKNKLFFLKHFFFQFAPWLWPAFVRRRKETTTESKSKCHKVIEKREGRRARKKKRSRWRDGKWEEKRGLLNF